MCARLCFSDEFILILKQVMIIEETGHNEDGNLAMANAMHKVLSIGKNSTKNKSLILTKAKTLDKLKSNKKSSRNDVTFEIDSIGQTLTDDKDELEEVKPTIVGIKRKRLQRREVASLGRVKPSVLDREKEKPLMNIATKGIVQLFNAIQEQQTIISKKIQEAGPSETKKEKVLKSIDKESFLGVLLGQINGNSTTTASSSNPEIKVEKEEKEQSWSVLRDDFMTGAKLKDWDKKDLETSTVQKKQKIKH